MPSPIDIAFLPNDEKLFATIADMYYTEWQVDRNKSIERLRKRAGLRFPFVLVAWYNDEPAGVAGLDDDMYLFSAHPGYKKYSPWLSLLYIKPEFRGKGIGSLLCNRAEAEAFRLGHHQIYLYTNTATSLYKKLGWTELEHFTYKGKDTVLMSKDM